jgi:hypothetical protein
MKRTLLNNDSAQVTAVFCIVLGIILIGAGLFIVFVNKENLGAICIVAGIILLALAIRELL